MARWFPLPKYSNLLWLPVIRAIKRIRRARGKIISGAPMTSTRLKTGGQHSKALRIPLNGPLLTLARFWWGLAQFLANSQIGALVNWGSEASCSPPAPPPSLGGPRRHSLFCREGPQFSLYISRLCHLVVTKKVFSGIGMSRSLLHL